MFRVYISSVSICYICGMYNNGACSFSGSSAAVKSSERKPLPLKTGNCLEILMPSKPSLPSNVSVYVYVQIICL